MPENTPFLPHVTDATLPESDLESPDVELEIEVTPEKSFNACLTCPYFRNGCSGPDLAVTTPDRACEFLRSVQILRKLSLAYTARESGLSVSTVRRILTGKEKNPSFYAIHRLCAVLVGDPNGTFPCALHIVSAETQKALAACQSATDDLARHKASAAAEAEAAQAQYDELRRLLSFHSDQLREKDHQLRQKDRYLRIFISALGISLVALLTVLVLWILALT